ncbi:hypothetical protein B0H15DRAFT_820472 [Mycena belliarum]|uniref:Uncharacterized protein n=1 Tax=Mycena belliarum TaxID=1033014 RepID=A0AAD6UGE6_9AGAR|nr:hypothetical protein B0H15DRAFT_820472 [Mycena belliae]
MTRCWSLTQRIIVFTAALTLLAVFLPLPSDSEQHLHHLSSPAAPESQHISASTPPSDECLHPPPDSCTFYADCLESRYHCGPTGYPLGYGQNYCNKFKAERATLSARGQTWMRTTMHCLQEALVPDAIGAPNATTNCAALEHKAFSTHAGCYVGSGVCTLPPSDWGAVLHIVELKTLFDSWDAFTATLTAGTECLEFYVFLLKQDR